MKKLGVIFLFFFSLFLFLGTNQASARQQYGMVNTNTYILDNGNDLGKIIPKGTYYTPRIPYTDGEAVKNQFLKELHYPGDFYSSRNIDAKLINNESPYFSVEWDRPYMVKSLSGIKRTLRGFLFAYRRNGDIFWTDAKNFTPAFLSGYETPENQSIIIYPVKNRKTRKIVAFLQYPCGNLVCKDTMCSDLKVTPQCGDGVVNVEVGEMCDPKDPATRQGCTNTCQYKELVCRVYNRAGESIDDKTRPTVKVEKDRHVAIKEYYLNREKFPNLRDINGEFLEPGVYKLNALAVNQYTNKEFLCEGGTIQVEGKEYCGDGKVSGNEECDYADPNNNGSCNRSCRFTDTSCSVKVKARKLEEPTRLSEVLEVKKPNNARISRIELNGRDVTHDNPLLSNDGDYTIRVSVGDRYSGKEASCEANLTYDTKEYCGDGIKNGYEQCDDGNTADGDGCSRTCRLERPYCKITRKGHVFEEGTPFSEYVTFDYRGKFETAVLNQDNVFNSMDALLQNVVPKNQCGGNSELSYTVSNPLDSSMTKTCTTTFRTHNKEYCGDGIVQKNEECDTKDPYTGAFCTASCTFKQNTECNVLNNAFTEGETGAIVIETDYSVIPSQLVIDGRKIRARNGIFKHRFNKAGTFKVTAMLQNKADDRNVRPSYCQFDIKVAESKCKVPGRRGESGGFWNFFRR